MMTEPKSTRPKGRVYLEYSDVFYLAYPIDLKNDTIRPHPENNSKRPPSFLL